MAMIGMEPGRAVGRSAVEVVGDREERVLEAFERRINALGEQASRIANGLGAEADRIFNEGATAATAGGEKSMAPAPQPGTIPAVSVALSGLEHHMDRLEREASRVNRI